jgi:hypothetical protein
MYMGPVPWFLLLPRRSFYWHMTTRETKLRSPVLSYFRAAASTKAAPTQTSNFDQQLNPTGLRASRQKQGT